MILVDSTFLRKKAERGQRKEKHKIWWTRGGIQRLRLWILNLPLEIGRRGLPVHSVWRLGFVLFCTGSNGETSLRRIVARKLGQATERSSCWIWLKRDKKSWKPTHNTQRLITTVDPPSWELVYRARGRNPQWRIYSLGWGRRKWRSDTIFNLPKCRNGIKKSWFPKTVLGFWKGCYQQKRFSSPIQAVCWPFNSRREIHADILH